MPFDDQHRESELLDMLTDGNPALELLMSRSSALADLFGKIHDPRMRLEYMRAFETVTSQEFSEENELAEEDKDLEDEAMEQTTHLSVFGEEGFYDSGD